MNSKILILDGGGTVPEARLFEAAEQLRNRKGRSKLTILTAPVGCDCAVPANPVTVVLRFVPGNGAYRACIGTMVSGYLTAKASAYAAFYAANDYLSAVRHANFRFDAEEKDATFTWYFFDPAFAERHLLAATRLIQDAGELKVTGYAEPLTSDIGLYDALRASVPLTAHDARFLQTSYHDIFHAGRSLYVEYGGAADTAEQVGAAAMPIVLAQTEALKWRNRKKD